MIYLLSFFIFITTNLFALAVSDGIDEVYKEINVISSIRKHKVFKIKSQNIRIGEHGYTWGRPAEQSVILDLLNLKSLDLNILEQEPVAELWLASDDSTYPSFVQLQDGTSISLEKFLEKYGKEVLGEQHCSIYGPCLAVIMKFLDAGESLSVQVHPAMDHPTRPAKPEMWLVEEGVESKLYLGFNRDVSEKELRKAYADSSFEGLLQEVNPKSGELILVDGGMIHAIRAGSAIWEWSHAPTDKEKKKGDLKKATVSPWDRTDGKKPRSNKEDIDGTIEVLEDAKKRLGVPVYDKIDLDKIYSKKVCMFVDKEGNKIDRLFETEHVVVEKMEIVSQLSLDTKGHGFPIFIKQGSVKVQTKQGELIAVLNQNECAIIPAYLGEYEMINQSEASVEIFKWYAPLNNGVEVAA
jgi:mannose-6-phosphate isomerase class I